MGELWLTLAVYALVGHQQEAAWSELYRQASTLEDAHQWEEAERIYVKSLREAEKLGGEHPAVGLTLNNMGLLMKRRGRAKEAERHYTRALQVLRSSLERRDRSVIKVAANLTSLYLERGQDAKAESVFRSYLPEGRLLNPDEAIFAGNFAAYLSRRHRYQEAEPIFKQAVEELRSEAAAIYRESFGVTLGNLAVLYRALGRVEEAAEHAAAAAAVLATLPPVSPVARAALLSQLREVFTAAAAESETKARAIRQSVERGSLAGHTVDIEELKSENARKRK